VGCIKLHMSFYWCFKDITINAFKLQKANFTIPFIINANDSFKSSPESTPKSRTFILGKPYLLKRNKIESKNSKIKFFHD